MPVPKMADVEPSGRYLVRLSKPHRLPGLTLIPSRRCEVSGATLLDLIEAGKVMDAEPLPALD